MIYRCLWWKILTGGNWSLLFGAFGRLAGKAGTFTGVLLCSLVIVESNTAVVFPVLAVGSLPGPILLHPFLWPFRACHSSSVSDHSSHWSSKSIFDSSVNSVSCTSKFFLLLNGLLSSWTPHSQFTLLCHLNAAVTSPGLSLLPPPPAPARLPSVLGMSQALFSLGTHCSLCPKAFT